MNKQNPDRSQELQTLMSGADEEQRLASEKEFQEISQVGKGLFYEAFPFHIQTLWDGTALKILRGDCICFFLFQCL